MVCATSLTALPFLYLGNNQLTALPSSINALTCLESLHLYLGGRGAGGRGGRCVVEYPFIKALKTVGYLTEVQTCTLRLLRE